MSELADIITGEFEEAVEVKNPKSLQRGIYLLLSSSVRKDEHDTEHKDIDSAMRTMGKNIELLAMEMREGFKQMDQRFETVNRRFEAVDRRFESMDKRFESMERSISRVTTILSTGILVLATLITVFKFLL